MAFSITSGVVTGKENWILLLVLSQKTQPRQWQPTPVLLPGKSHGWRSLAGYNPWGCKESDTTERLHTTTMWPTCQVDQTHSQTTDSILGDAELFLPLTEISEK